MSCGARLALTCDSCGTELPAAAAFCFSCGRRVGGSTGPDRRFASPESYTPRHLAERILTSKAALEGERKQVTVLFADLKGSMELLADRDPEEARSLLDPLLQQMIEAVHHYEGTVNQVLGDGIMALFGAPLAHEDHAVRACYAALRMQDAVNRHPDTPGRWRPQIRVGLNSGEVVVRAIGNDLHMDYSAIGQTTHLAARMEQLAAPGTILLTPSTLALAEGHISMSPLGPVEVKGLTARVEVYELTGVGAMRSRLQNAVARGLSGFVGRGDEVEGLSRTLERARSGHGQLAAVVGEPGVGKSRLVLELIASPRTQGCLILEAGAVSYGKAMAYYPLVDLLKKYLGVDDRDAHDDVRHKVTAKIQALDETLQPVRPAVLSLLDVPTGDPQWEALDPAQRRRQTIEGVRRMLIRESQVRPVLVLFEDLHWIDSETQALLDGVIEWLPTARLMVLVTYRPEYAHAWGSKTFYTQLRLDPLPPADASQLLDSLLGTDGSLSPVKALLAAKTEGNPFFLEEGARMLVETQVLVGARGAYRLVQSVDGLQVPATVQSILAGRIDRLPPEEKRLLETAAVIGKDFPLALLHAVTGESDETLQHQLDRLRAGELIYETGFDRDRAYTFKHALTHDVTLSRLLTSRVRALHAAIVAAMEQLYGGRLAEHVERLAHHAFQGELWDKALRYLHQAGLRATRRSANREALGLLDRALEAIGHLPPSRDTLSATLDIELVRGPALSQITGFGGPEVDAIYSRARDLCEQLGEQTRLFPVLWGLWMKSMASGRYDTAVEMGERLRDVADAEGHPAFYLEARHCLGPTLLAQGHPTVALARCDEALRLYDQGNHEDLTTLYAGHDAGMCCQSHAGMALWFLGFPDQALARLERARAFAREHPASLANAFAWTAWLRFHRGEKVAAREALDAGLAVATTHRLSAYEREWSVFRQLCVLDAHDRDAVARVEAAVTSPTMPGLAWRRGVYRRGLAEAIGRAGRARDALVLLDVPAADIGEADAYRIRGELQQQMGAEHLDDAKASFRRAIEIARRHDIRSYELRAVTGLARLLGRTGDAAQGKHLLAGIYGWFREGFETADLREAAATLETLGQ
jgi:class 3 adenylate cyclase/tetratricopeptide (TPR) repeat protein